MTINAVPTTYAGTRFQSTLEADWAATLDSLNIEWQYEPEAVQLPSGSLYRPDFYLPQMTTWLEVKGPHNDRLDKTRELEDATQHDPGCEDAMRGHTLTVTVIRDEHESAVEQLIRDAPDGDSPVIVHSKRYSSPTDDVWDTRKVSEKTFKPRRTIKLTNAVTDAFVNSGATSTHWDDGCTHDWSNPWRLVVVGRAAARGQIVFERPDGDRDDLLIIKCASCAEYSFFDEYGAWRCRRCNTGGKVYHGGTWGSGGTTLRHHDGTLPFLRASRYGRTMPAVKA